MRRRAPRWAFALTTLAAITAALVVTISGSAAPPAVTLDVTASPTQIGVASDVLLEAQPTKQFVTVDQVAALAVFLTSDAASQITGANLSMDGGWTAE